MTHDEDPRRGSASTDPYKMVPIRLEQWLTSDLFQNSTVAACGQTPTTALYITTEIPQLRGNINKNSDFYSSLSIVGYHRNPAAQHSGSRAIFHQYIIKKTTVSEVSIQR